MPQLTVTAVDGFTAMDEIVGKLGEDAVILSTRKVGSKVQITATNESKTPLPPRRAKKKSAPETFEDVFIDADLSLKPADEMRTTADILAEKDAAQHTDAIYDAGDDDLHDTDQRVSSEDTSEMIAATKPRQTIIDLFPEEESLETSQSDHNANARTLENWRSNTSHESNAHINKLESQIAQLQETVSGLAQKIAGMVMTPPDGLSSHTQNQLPYRLKQAGFSDQARLRFSQHLDADDLETAKSQFTQAMATAMTQETSTPLMAHDVFVIVGSSGSGKTALSAKIAAHLRDQSNATAITLASYDPDKIDFSGANRNHARLLNLPFVNLATGNMDHILSERSGKLIIDCSAHPDSVAALMQELQTTHSRERIALIVTISALSSPAAITQALVPFKNDGAIIALTHLDECELSASEFSALAESDAKIGLLTATQSFIDALVIADPKPIQQYLLNQI